MSSGMPFTPMVMGDINGDGVQADRAFIFDPAETSVPESVARGIEGLLAEAPSGARECLRTQIGRVADHNSCRSNWTGALDLTARASLGPLIPGSVAHRRISLWLYARNVPAGLDYLLHGSDDLRGWGQVSQVDQTLLSVRGFDPVARRFHYDVNSRFGSRPAQAALRRAPFMLSVQVRVVLGTDRPLAVFNEQRNASSNQQEAFAPANVALHLMQQLPNLPAEVLSLNGPQRLYLTPVQAARLQQAADSMELRIDRIVGELTRLIAAPYGAPPPPEPARIRELASEAAALRNSMRVSVRSILDDGQWSKLSEQFRKLDVEFVPYPTVQLTGSKF